MFKKIILLIVLLLVLPVVFSCTDPIDCESLKLRLLIKGDLSLSSAGKNADIDYLQVSLSYVPRNNFRESIESISYGPNPYSNDGSEIIFYWKNPSITKKEYYVDTTLITRNAYLPIKTKNKFPLTDLPLSVYDYTRPSKLIDVNEDISNLAAEIASGNTDEFVVVSKLAEWVNQNIEYDLNSVTADASQKASWVLDNRQGVCDEITNLFIAMCRSVGIPARFVSGISYTNLPEFENPWGPHGWAEVYFPEVGWVPFDATYGEYGYLDATHISLKQSLDGDKSTLNFEWRAYNVDITPGKISTDVEVIQKDSFAQKIVSVTTKSYAKNVGFGSYNLITAEVSNSKNHYLAQEYSLSVPKEIEIISPKKQLAILTPYRSTKIYWIIKTPTNLEKNYVYTFPFTVYTPQNDSADSEFFVKKDETFLTYDYVNSLIEKELGLDDYPYSKEVELNCVIPQKVELNQEAKVTCTINNNGNSDLNSLNVCYSSICKKINMQSKTDEEIIFLKNQTQSGQIVSPISAKNDLVQKYDYLSVFVYDLTKLSIANISAPSNVNFEDEFDINFLLQRESVSIPTNVNVTLFYNKNSERWDFESVKTSEAFRFSMPANILKEGTNQFILKAEYDSESGERIIESKEFVVNLEDLSFSQMLQMWINQLSLFLERLTSN